MLNPIYWKKVQGQKHPGRWGIVEHQIPSIKVLLKINAESHKHPGIKLEKPEKYVAELEKPEKYVAEQIFLW